MMASFMSYFGARKDPKQSARDAIVTLRHQLQMLEKKEEHLQKKIDEELKKAKQNAVSNKPAATAALKRKKMHENELDKIAGTRLQLEVQVNTLESANLNAETMAAMKKAASALKDIHGNMTLDKVDKVMADVQEQGEIAKEIADVISAPTSNDLLDEDELQAELAGLEEDVLNERLSEAEHAPIYLPPSAAAKEKKPAAIAEDDEEAQLRELQAALAM